MTSLTDLPAFAAFATSTLVLAFNLIGVANATAFTRAKASEVVNPEDRALNRDATVVFDGGNDKTARYRRAHRNALENIPLFLITALVLTMMGTVPAIAAVLFYAFAGLRLVFTVCYLRSVQPLRTISFAASVLVQVSILVLIGYGAFAS